MTILASTHYSRRDRRRNGRILHKIEFQDPLNKEGYTYTTWIESGNRNYSQWQHTLDHLNRAGVVVIADWHMFCERKRIIDADHLPKHVWLVTWQELQEIVQEQTKG